MDQKDRVFTPAFVANLFLIAGTVFLLLKGKINAYVGVDGLKHEMEWLWHSLDLVSWLSECAYGL